MTQLVRKRFISLGVVFLLSGVLFSGCAGSQRFSPAGNQSSSPAGNQSSSPAGSQSTSPADSLPAGALTTLNGLWILSGESDECSFDSILICDEQQAVMNNDQKATWSCEGDELCVTISDTNETFRYQVENGSVPTLKLMSSSTDTEIAVLSYSRVPDADDLNTLENIQPESEEYSKLIKSLNGEWQIIGNTNNTGISYFLLQGDYLLATEHGTVSYEKDGVWTTPEEYTRKREGTWSVDGNKLSFIYYGNDIREYLFYINGQYLMVSNYFMKDNPVLEWDYFYKIPGSDEFRSHTDYAPADFDESTATMEEAAKYLVGTWTPEGENGVPGTLPESLWLGYSEKEGYVVSVTEQGEDIRGSWFVDEGTFVLSFSSLYSYYYDYDVSDNILTLSHYVTDGTLQSATYIRD